MKKIRGMKYLYLAALLIAVTVFTAKIQVRAEETVVDSGAFGTISWEVTSDGVLTISGTGVLATSDAGVSESEAWDYCGPDYSDFITTVVIEEGITGLDGTILFDFGETTKVSLPASVEYVGSYVFWQCFTLEEIEVDESNPYFTSIDGVLYNKDATTLICVPEGRTGTVTVAETTLEIGESAFYFCENLDSVILPEGLLVIGDGAFVCCYAELSLPSTLTTIGDSAFYESTCLEGDIVIPASVTSIGECAFLYCTSITTIVIEGDITRIEDLTFGHAAIESLTIPASVTSIHPYAFELMGLWADDPAIIFEGDAPTFDDIEEAFAGYTGKVYYPAGNSTWTEKVIESFNNDYNDITWVAYGSSEEETSTTEAAETETTTAAAEDETASSAGESETMTSAIAVAADNSGNEVAVYSSEEAAEAAGETGAYLVITTTTETIDLTDTDIATLIASDTDAAEGDISVLSLVEVYAVGDVEFPLTLTFTVEGISADNFVAVLHKVDGTWQAEEAEVDADGNVVVTVESLSPFAFLVSSTEDDGTTAADGNGEAAVTTASSGGVVTGTGDVQTWSYIVLLMGAAVCAVAIARKKENMD